MTTDKATSKPKPPKLKIVYRKREKLIPSARNSNTHSKSQVAEIAASIKEFGWTNPVLTRTESSIHNVIAGHGRLLAAELLDENDIPCIELGHLTVQQARAYLIADNRLAELAEWDFEMLRTELEELDDEGFDIALTGFDEEFLEGLKSRDGGEEETGEHDNLPPMAAAVTTVRGDIWELGKHRVMCGDSTDPVAVKMLMDGETALLIHADPPYGMGKQADGVENDNLYREKLDAFQLQWWQLWRKFTDDKASAYIWGNAPDLWRLWYAAGLSTLEKFSLRNQIVWDKKSIPGMASHLMTQYPIATEHCLFFQFGDQFLGNINADDYWEGWDEIRLYLADQAERAQLTAGKCREITGVQMYGHWFSKSQWAFINPTYYGLLADACPGFFEKPHKELRETYDKLRGGFREYFNGMQGGIRSYFDNAHSSMTDVWDFPRVTGEDRYGHATPKPVDMMSRIVRSSLPEGAVCAEPFAGTGSTLIACEVTDRRCYTMELTPAYCDIVVQRWQELTGLDATDQNGVKFNARDTYKSEETGRVTDIKEKS